MEIQSSSKKEGKKPAEETPSSKINDHKPLLQHQTAISALASLPLKTVITVFRHQWHKDKERMTFAHAEQFMYEHDIPVLKTELPNITKYRPQHWKMHSFQLHLLKEDLTWHREKFIKLYLNALVASTRVPNKEPLTRSRCRSIRRSLTSELRISVPRDFYKVYYGKGPAHINAAIEGRDVQDISDVYGAERHPMILCVPICINLWSIHQDDPDLLPKNPAP
ncbi:hypothetical protein M426DRAFT_15129 [Hypoxylon sp. CI-4A]|nr:hypothetical protein M426DRAFT_15129 [Hypoxylon sp. CI-4A]